MKRAGTRRQWRPGGFRGTEASLHKREASTVDVQAGGRERPTARKKAKGGRTQEEGPGEEKEKQAGKPKKAAAPPAATTTARPPLCRAL